VKFEVAGVGSLPLREGGYDAVVSGLALNFFPDPSRAMEEQLEVLSPGGCVGAFVWDYSDGMEFLRHFWGAASSIDPGAADADEGRRFSICNPDSLKSLFEAAGTDGVRGDSISIPTTFTSFEDYWRPFLGGTGPAPNLVSKFSAQECDALVDELKRRLPIQSNGSIELQTRAWAVAGHRS
jgi:SAM-dependent methyltransferase